MQNIKVCPKCNQVTTDSTKSFCPFDGAALVEMQPVSNQQTSRRISNQQNSQQISMRLPEGVLPSAKIREKKVSILLGFGIFLMPYIFAWVTLQKGYSNLARIVSFSWAAMLIMVNLPIILSNNDKPAITKQRNSSSLVSSNSTATVTSAATPQSSALSSKENLEAGKKALSNGDLSTAKSHLSAIPKEAKEFTSAKQYLATLERREKRKAVEDELESVKRDEANAEDMLNRTEHMEGTIGKNIYANALKRKAELQLKRIKLEQKLKGMP